jgi:intracellular multiplication protein IcmJ
MADLYPLKLSAKPGTWRLFSARKTDPKFQEFSKRVFMRDNYTCQFCGFQASRHQEIVNLNQNYQDNTLSNLVTACCFCAQCFFLETIGKDELSGGVLIYLPELSQGELNGFCHVLFCAMANATNYQEDAQAIYRSLKLRTQIVDKELGEGMSNPILLSQVLIDTPNQDRSIKIVDEVLAPLRLLPSQSRFSKQIDDWAKAALSELSESK